MGNPNEGAGRSDPANTEATRDASAEERIEQRRQHDKEISQREEEGYAQPESSAQKKPNPGPRP